MYRLSGMVEKVLKATQLLEQKKTDVKKAKRTEIFFEMTESSFQEILWAEGFAKQLEQ